MLFILTTLLLTSVYGGGAPPPSDCAPRDFVNTVSSPTIDSANFARNDDVDAEDTFGNGGMLTFGLSTVDFATLDEVRFENDSGDTVSNDVLGFDYSGGVQNGCRMEYSSGSISWMDFKDHLILRTTGNPETGTHTELHYRAEVVVKSSLPYAPNTFEDEGVDAMDGEERTRSLTSTFQLYFTLPERVQAWARITVAELPTAGVVENIQMQDVASTLDREDLTYKTVIGLHSTINWPYTLTFTSVDAAEADSAGVEERDGERVNCERSGDEDDEPDCQQFWTLTVNYGAICGDDVEGDVDIVFTHTNSLPNLGGEDVADNGTSSYTIEVSGDAIQCEVDAGDIDVFATLAAAEGSTFEIGGSAEFTFEITGLETPGVEVTHLALEQVRTAQDGEARMTHVEGGVAVTGDTFNGSDGNSAVTLTDTSSANGGNTGFSLEFHQTIFNLDKFVDGSTETMRVDVTGVITYGSTGRRRRRLLNFGHKLKTAGKTEFEVEYKCASNSKAMCKKAKTTEGRCKWSKRKCVPKKAGVVCEKLSPKKCKLSPKCAYRNKNKKCFDSMKLKCNEIANSAKLCAETRGCLAVYSGKNFKSCRGTVKMG